MYVIFGVHFYVFGVILKCKEFTEHFLHFLHLSAMEKLPTMEMHVFIQAAYRYIQFTYSLHPDYI